MTREQVVAVFGEPQESYAEDQVVLYKWDRAQGIYLMAPAAGKGDIRSGKSKHRICLKYSKTGMLEQFEHVRSTLGGDTSANKVIKGWVAEIGGWPAWYPVLWEDRDYYPDIDHVTLNPGLGGPAVAGDTTLQAFVAILGHPFRAFQNERFLLYESSDPKYFEPVTGTEFDVPGNDAAAPRNRQHYYALLAQFDSSSVLKDMQVIKWWPANGPYQLAPIVADAFGGPSGDLLFVRPFDGGYHGTLDGGVYVATQNSVGVAVWKRNHYELLWKHAYSEIDSISAEQYRSGTFWLEQSVRILVRLHSGETIAIEPFERDADGELSTANNFVKLVSALIPSH